MTFEKKQIQYNRTKRTGKILYIVIHDTGNKGKGASADAHFKYFNGGNRSASADFFVDSEKVLQINDYNLYATWHVGDGKGKYGITNQNSVGVEICVNSDGNYEEAVKKAVALTKFLMQKLNIPKERVVRHFDASRKNCPASMTEQDWNAFKKKLEEEPEMEKTFCDISGHYGEKAILDLQKKGIVNGVDETHFAPDSPIKRADVAIIARNVIRYILGE